MARPKVTIDGNEAAASVAYRASEVIAIYPITPSSPMGEWSDEWAAKGLRNIWGGLPIVREMQSEGGASGAVHGSLQAGALTTTFTASQGLLLMIPNMFKIAGELTSTVFHVSARTVATHALSIFGDHSDVMAARSTGWGLLFSNSVQEVHDLALIATAATLQTRVPFVHAFDGFRTSHEVQKIEQLTDDDIRAMIDNQLVAEHRARSLSPDRPVMRGTAQNPDVFFQAREACNTYYNEAPDKVQLAMDRFAEVVGRAYHLFDYYGAPDAERVVIMMGSGCEAAEEAIDALMARGEKVGLIKVRLYRPFSAKHLLAAIPATVKAIAVLDRTKEPGAAGEPLYQDVLTAVGENLMAASPVKQFPALRAIVGGRYGLSSKEFTPAQVKAVLDNLSASQPKNHFVVGIVDDVTGSSLPVDPNFFTETDDVKRAMFWGLGADGTVGANKNSIKIIGEETDFYAQGYFVYDSKKSGAMTVSHLRFGSKPIRSTYLIQKSQFVAVHQFEFVNTHDVLANAADGGTFLLNSPFPAEEVWDHLPRITQQRMIDKKMRFYVINAYDVAKKTNMGVRINTIMQTCHFAISGVLPRDEAIAQIKKAIKKTYGKRGDAVVQQNYAAVDAALDHLHEVAVPASVTSDHNLRPPVPAEAPEFLQKVTAEIIAGRGDQLPVSAMPIDGTFPTDTARWEKRNIALEVPQWDPSVCIQCGKCVLVCPHACLRAKLVTAEDLKGAPEGFQTAPAKGWREFPDRLFTIAVAIEDCTGCRLCVNSCPAKDKTNVSRRAVNMAPQIPLRATEPAKWEFFLNLPEAPRDGSVAYNNVKKAQLLQPLFEFSGACAGCGETPYIKLITQLFGDRMVIGNATGCSSIYGGNLPTTPYAKNRDGRGPAWSNSLFEDNAEFGLGMRLAIDAQASFARDLITAHRDQIGAELADALLNTDQSTEAGISQQRQLVSQLKDVLSGIDAPYAKDLAAVADYLVKKSVWAFGGAGWAYDIGYGGLDHVMASGANINILVLDTEVYSNTGGQASKSTPYAAVAKFAAGGKPSGKKDLGAMVMRYGNVYVAQVAMGANDAQTLRAIQEAEAWDGPSLIIAYSHCINHGIDMSMGLQQHKLAVDSGHWALYRYNPALKAEGKNPFQLDSPGPKIPLKDYITTEGRYQILMKANPEAAAFLAAEGQKDVDERWAFYRRLATDNATE